MRTAAGSTTRHAAALGGALVAGAAAFERIVLAIVVAVEALGYAGRLRFQYFS